MGQSLAVFMVLGVHFPGIGVVHGIVRTTLGVVHAEYVEKLCLDRDVSERSVSEAFQHAPGCRKDLPSGAISAPTGRTKPVEVLVAVVVVIEKGRAEAEIVGRQACGGVKRVVHFGGIERSRRHVGAGSHLHPGGDVREIADLSHDLIVSDTVVSQQVMKAVGPRELDVIFACTGYLFFRRPHDEVISHVGNEHVKIRVAVEVAKGESHPRADSVKSHLSGYGSERRAAGGGIVAVHVEPMPSSATQRSGSRSFVVVEEGSRVGLARGFANLISPSVLVGRIVTLERLSRIGVLKHDRLTVVAAHDDLGALNACGLRSLFKCEIAIIEVKEVVVTGVTGRVECPEVGVTEVSNVEIEPSVRVHVSTCDAGRGPDVCAFAKSCFRNVLESAILTVQEEPVGNSLPKLSRLLI